MIKMNFRKSYILKAPRTIIYLCVLHVIKYLQQKIGKEIYSGRTNDPVYASVSLCEHISQAVTAE